MSLVNTSVSSVATSYEHPVDHLNLGLLFYSQTNMTRTRRRQEISFDTMIFTKLNQCWLDDEYV